MICQNCKSAQATVCVTQVADSKKTDTYLCQKCANDSAAIKLSEAFGQLGSPPGYLMFGAGHNPYAPQVEAICCAGCGTTFAEIQKSGKLGCARCYSTFRAKLRPIVTRIHRSAQHRGKSPRGAFDATAEASGAPPSAPPDTAGIGVPSYGAPGETNGCPPGETTVETTDRPQSVTQGIPPGTAGNQAPYFRNGKANRLKRLKALLAAAIREEEYEKAAAIRDQIKALDI